MTEVITRAAHRPALVGRIDPTLAGALGRLLVGTSEAQGERTRSAVAAFCAWIEATDADFPGYDEAFEAYSAAMSGTQAASTLPYVQLLLVVLRERGGNQPRGAHAA